MSRTMSAGVTAMRIAAWNDEVRTTSFSIRMWTGAESKRFPCARLEAVVAAGSTSTPTS